jgi:hypothetical protein
MILNISVRLAMNLLENIKHSGEKTKEWLTSDATKFDMMQTKSVSRQNCDNTLLTRLNFSNIFIIVNYLMTF